jgi:hypothetical protein
MQEGPAWELRSSAIGATLILILTLGFQASEGFSEWEFQASEGFKQVRVSSKWGFKQVMVSSKWRLQTRFQWGPGFEARVWGQGLRQLKETTQSTSRSNSKKNSKNFKKQLKEATQTISRGNSNNFKRQLKPQPQPQPPHLVSLLTFSHSQWSNAQTGWMSWQRRTPKMAGLCHFFNFEFEIP